MVPIWSFGRAGGLQLVADFVDGLRDTLAIERLQQIVDGIHFERLDGVLIVGGSEDDLRQRHLAVQQLLDDAEAVETRHLHVKEDEIGRELLDQVDGLDSVLALSHDVDIETRAADRRVRRAQVARRPL